MTSSAAVRERLASPAHEVRRRWRTAARLAAAVNAQLGGGAELGEEVVAERLRQLQAVEPATLYSFRHIFLRLDRAASAGERQATRARARDLARRAGAGEDFVELVRRHSESADATEGGLVENNRAADLEETARRTIEALEEGEVSPVVETRTGLHVFRLERRITPLPPPAEQLAAQARRGTAAMAQARRRQQLLAELRDRIEVEVEDFPWRVGRFELDEADLAAIGSGAAGQAREVVVAQLLFAEEGYRRGLLTPELEALVDRELRATAIQAVTRQRQAELVAAVSDAQLRPLYEAQPSGFATTETARLDLIFVSQGRDSFVTQQRLEEHVAALRAGASFAELARQISTGPGAVEGGDLGALPPREWARLNPAIYRAVLAMEAGEISDPIYCTEHIMTADPRTQRGGFAILRVGEKEPPRPRSYEEAIDEVRAVWARRNAAEIAEQLRAQILEEADFEIVRVPDPDEFLR